MEFVEILPLFFTFGRQGHEQYHGKTSVVPGGLALVVLVSLKQLCLILYASAQSTVRLSAK